MRDIDITFENVWLLMDKDMFTSKELKHWKAHSNNDEEDIEDDDEEEEDNKEDILKDEDEKKIL